MIIQACINGSRTRDFHPLLPLTMEAIARDAAATVAAGAAELHIHPHDVDGRESLLAVEETIDAVRRACPGTLVGVSTGAWIEGDARRTREAIRRWREPLLPTILTNRTSTTRSLPPSSSSYHKRLSTK